MATSSSPPPPKRYRLTREGYKIMLKPRSDGTMGSFLLAVQCPPIATPDETKSTSMFRVETLSHCFVHSATDGHLPECRGKTMDDIKRSLGALKTFYDEHKDAVHWPQGETARETAQTLFQDQIKAHQTVTDEINAFVSSAIQQGWLEEVLS